jgi:hypothetical protein
MDQNNFIKGFPDHGHVVPVGNFATNYLSLKAKAMGGHHGDGVYDAFRALGFEIITLSKRSVLQNAIHHVNLSCRFNKSALGQL